MFYKKQNQSYNFKLKIMKSAYLKSIIVTAGLVLFSVSANAQEAKPEHKKHDKEEMFKKMDANNDGKLSAEEIKEDSPLKEKFAKIDANADGFITKEEMESAHKAKKEGKI